jgi:hypothetical protein
MLAVYKVLPCTGSLVMGELEERVVYFDLEEVIIKKIQLYIYNFSQYIERRRRPSGGHPHERFFVFVVWLWLGSTHPDVPGVAGGRVGPRGHLEAPRGGGRPRRRRSLRQPRSSRRARPHRRHRRRRGGDADTSAAAAASSSSSTDPAAPATLIIWMESPRALRGALLEREAQLARAVQRRDALLGVPRQRHGGLGVAQGGLQRVVPAGRRAPRRER